MSETGSSASLTPRTLRHAVVHPRSADAHVLVENGDAIVALRVPDGRTHVGRGFTADIELDDPTVSRRHAILIKDVLGVRILDDRSENGVYVNGVRTSECSLHDGDWIELGRVRLRFLLAPDRSL
jgi:pSer/pThr/pTyr-binding forkhead associated (FHA) protein